MIRQMLLKLSSAFGRKKIRVCFSVVYPSAFPGKPLFDAMMSSEIFEPFILIIPDVMRGNDNMFYQMEKAYKVLSDNYSNVYNSFDYNKKKFIDFNNKAELFCLANPYDEMTHEFYGFKHILKSNKKYLHVNYAYLGRMKYEKSLLSGDFYKNAWMLFVESEKTLKEIKNNNPGLDNLYLVGYCKMDDISNIKKIERKRKKIIIAPHHTIGDWEGGLNLSNFLTYAEFFLELPRYYPQVDFVFRPHPLLFTNLKQECYWGEDKTEQYIVSLKSFSNVTYDTKFEYFDTFINSDGLIHDCGSFLAEYFYTENPQCFLLNLKRNEDEFLEFGKEMLKNCYKAFNKNEIVNFIDEVILNNNDSMRRERNIFANEYIKLNHQNVSQIIIDTIIEELL